MKFKYLRPEDIRQLETFAFAPKALVEGYLAGRHRSRAIGSSTEFRDFRPYVPGDDLRQLDWRVYARTDRPYLRTHVHETNTVCHIFLDSSASMGFGSPLSKLDYASFFSAALTYLILRNRDTVSLQLFDSRIRSFLPPGSTNAHLHECLNLLERNKAGSATSLANALRRGAGLLQRRGTLVVLSDFFDDTPAIFEALNPYLHRGFEIHLFQIIDPGELTLTARGLATYVDMENDARIIAHTETIQQRYQTALQEHISAIREMAARRGIRFSSAPTNRPFFELFDEWMQ